MSGVIQKMSSKLKMYRPSENCFSEAKLTKLAALEENQISQEDKEHLEDCSYCQKGLELAKQPPDFSLLPKRNQSFWEIVHSFHPQPFLKWFQLVGGILLFIVVVWNFVEINQLKSTQSEQQQYIQAENDLSTQQNQFRRLLTIQAISQLNKELYYADYQKQTCLKIPRGITIEELHSRDNGGIPSPTVTLNELKEGGGNLAF